jgi:hypothetical protein
MHVGAATTSHIAIDEKTAVVRIDHVLHAPDAFARMEGHQITVQLSLAEDTPAAGESLAFFTQGLTFGDSMAVTEVGRLSVEAVQPHAQMAAEAGKTAGAFDALAAEVDNDAFRARAAGADAVVLGQITGIEKIDPSGRSEHDPDWWQATINVTHVEKGGLKVGPVKVAFANSRDVRWHHAPKPRAGQTGLWLLQKGDGANSAPYQILDAHDMQPTQQLDVLRAPGV